MRENLDKLVKEGKVSKKDADARFEEAVNRYKKSLGDQDSRKAPKRKGSDKAQAKSKAKGGNDKAAAAREKIIEAVKAGKLSKEDAMQKIEGLKKKMFDDHDKKDWDDKKKGSGDKKEGYDKREAKFNSFEKEIWGAVKAGKLSKEAAQKKRAGLKKEIWGRDLKKDSGD